VLSPQDNGTIAARNPGSRCSYERDPQRQGAGLWALARWRVGVAGGVAWAANRRGVGVGQMERGRRLRRSSPYRISPWQQEEPCGAILGNVPLPVHVGDKAPITFGRDGRAYSPVCNSVQNAAQSDHRAHLLAMCLLGASRLAKCRCDVELLGSQLTNHLQRAAEAWAVTILDIEDDLSTRQVSRQRTMIAIGAGIAPLALSTRSDIGSILAGLVRGDRLLQIFQPELQLIGPQLLGAAAEPMAQQALDQHASSSSFVRTTA